ncbi:MAG: hypothetical protein P9X24_03005 [Candidatus Hatepunaea meridiana]|nr:hypothetical protein [Candidatus Hatepunaea meridiana]
MKVANLWGENLDSLKGLIPPIDILRTQAELLTEKTKGRVQGVIKKGEVEGKDGLDVEFVLLVKELNNYKYQLFRIHYSRLVFYPLFLWTPENDEMMPTIIDSEDRLILVLMEILGSTKTRMIIESLLSQVTKK